MKIRNRGAATPVEISELEEQLRSLESLADVLAWGRDQPPGVMSPAVITDVIVQDEFTHDAVVPWRNRALVFGST